MVSTQSVIPPLTPMRPPRNYVRIIVPIVALILLIAACYGAYLYFKKPPQNISDTATTFNSGDLNGTLRQLDEILKENPDNLNALIQKSIALSELALASPNPSVQGAEARTVAEHAVEVGNEASSEAYRALGYAHAVLGNLSAAHEAYEKAIAIDPKNALAHAGNAEIHTFEGNFVEARAGFEAALAIDATTYAANLGLGHVNALSGDREAAKVEFKKVYASPNMHTRAQAATSLGILVAEEGNYDLARAYLEQAVQMDPYYAQAWFGLGSAYYGQASKAIADPANGPFIGPLMVSSLTALQKAITFSPTHTYAHYQYAVVLAQTGQNSAARAAAEVAISAIPKDRALSVEAKAETLEIIEAFIATLE